MAEQFNAKQQQSAEEQQKFMEEEHCILVDEKDVARGHESKKFCHIMSNINGDKALHRAFSVFLFNRQGKLLLQQRAHDKITFPLLWTNTCCSHPLYNIENERPSVEECAQGDESSLGVVHAAVRKLEHELGVNPSDLQRSKFQYMTRILYKAAYDDAWGEHEVDYCLMYHHTEESDIALKLNFGEVEDVKYVTAEELKSMMADPALKFTPWFKLICDRFLWTWWDSLLKGEDLAKHKDPLSVHKLN